MLDDFAVQWWEILARLALAAVFGALVGWDREAHGHDAGLRTNMLVALGAAGFALIAAEFLELHSAAAADAGVSAQESSNASGGSGGGGATSGGSPIGMDPLRIVAAIVGGVGFLGAGAIMQSGNRVHGLTTAAGLWLVAGVGAASGLGFYTIAGSMTGLAVVILTLVRFASDRIGPDESDSGVAT